MGEAGKDALRVGFDRAIKLSFHGARVILILTALLTWPTLACSVPTGARRNQQVTRRL